MAEVVDCEGAGVHGEDYAHAEEVDIEVEGAGRVFYADGQVVEAVVLGGGGGGWVEGGCWAAGGEVAFFVQVGGEVCEGVGGHFGSVFVCVAGRDRSWRGVCYEIDPLGP